MSLDRPAEGQPSDPVLSEPVPSSAAPSPRTSSPGDATPRDAAAREAQARAAAQVAEAVGNLMEFWNFKPSMGKVWTILYLSSQSLDAEEIEARTGLSAGNVSTTLADLQKWGAVKRGVGGGRRRVFTAETDVWALVARVFAERELRIIEEAIGHFEVALQVLDREGKSSQADAMLEGRFVATRVERLRDLALTGKKLVSRLSRTGTVNLRPIRDVLLAGTS